MSLRISVNEGALFYQPAGFIKLGDAGGFIVDIAVDIVGVEAGGFFLYAAVFFSCGGSRAEKIAECDMAAKLCGILRANVEVVLRQE